MKFFNTIAYSLVTVFIFFVLIISFGWLDTGGQATAEIIKNIFWGNYLFFSLPIFVGATIAFGIGQYGMKGLFLRLLLVLLVAFGFYYAMARFLITRLNG